jgi:hypothetical protein
VTGPRVTAPLVALLALVVVLAGCRADDDPRSELESALAATASEPFRFAVTAQADRAALEELGGDAVAAASFLDAAGVTGARDPDGWLQVAFTIGGDVPLIEVIVPGDDRLLLRTGLGDLLGLGGRDPDDALGPALTELGVDEEGRAALAISFRGGWIALTDVDSIGELVGASTGAVDDADGGSVGDTGGEPLPADLGAVLDEVTILGVHDVGEIRRFDVEVRTAGLLGPLGIGARDRRVPGTIDLRDGRFHEARIELSGDDLGAGTAPGVQDGGTVEVVVRVVAAEEGGPVVDRTEPGASLTSAELFTLVEQLQGVTGQPAP